MHFGNLMRDCQAQARADFISEFGTFCSVESVEDIRQVFRLYSDSIVRYFADRVRPNVQRHSRGYTVSVRSPLLVWSRTEADTLNTDLLKTVLERFVVLEAKAKAANDVPRLRVIGSD